MKKIKIIVVLVICLAVFMITIMAMMFASIGSGGAGSVASPLIAFATEDEAYAYQYIGTELGVPWDIVMLADGMKAYEEGAKDLTAYNPILTSLEFCIILEDKMVPKEEDSETDSEDDETEIEDNQEEDEEENSENTSKKKKEDIKEPEWVSEKITYYTGRTEILKYIKEKADDLTFEDVNSIVTAINEVAEDKSTEDVKYVSTIICNPDFEDVLRNFIKLEDKNIEAVMEIYSSNYLLSLYGYTYDFTDIVLPDIVQGNVTRQDLANVAISLIGHPYCMGGKSSQTGAPSGPLDCSGYVDWVYIQCFGVGASNGTIPEGVAVSGTAQQWYASVPVSQKDLKVGDLGFYRDPAAMRSGQVNHVGIFIGYHDGKMYWIHCGGSAYGTEASPKGRVGISLSSGYNSYNPVNGTSFEPSMKGCNFRYYRRPQFSFISE